MSNDANTLSFSQKWAKRMQIVDHKEAVYRAFCNRQGEAELTEGQVWNKQYRGALYTRAVTRGTDFGVQTWTNTNETLTVSTQREITFYYDDFDKLQSHLNDQQEYSYDSGRRMAEYIDGDALAEVANAHSSVDNADIAGGTAGDGFTPSTSNIITALALAEQRLGIRGINAGLVRKAFVGPHWIRIVREYLAGKDTPLADDMLRNGRVVRAMGWDFHLTNNGYWTGVLTMDTNPTNADTITFQIWDVYSGSTTITITFLATLAANAGEVHIASTVDITRANLATFLNTYSARTTDVTEATDAGVTALSTANAYRLEGWSFTNSNSADTLTVTAQGVGFVNVGETLTTSTNVWTTGSEIQHNLFCAGDPVDLIVQAEPSVQVNKAPLRKGVYILNAALWGKKTFRDGARRMVDVKVNSSGFSF